MEVWHKMATQTVSQTIIRVRRGLSTEWTTKNPILTAGEIGFETDTQKMKIGNGTLGWNALKYQNANADKLTTTRTISISGDATGSATFDGSANTTIAVAINNLPSSKIAGLGTAASKNTGVASGNIPVLNASGKLEDSVLPPLSISEIFVVNSQAEMLALTAQKGDIAVRRDVNKNFILQNVPATTLANWIELATAPPPVISVNAKTGAVVLASTDLSDGATVIKTTDVLILDGGTA